MQNINVIRIASKFKELFGSNIDMSDNDGTGNHYESRALASMALVMKCGIEPQKACNFITDGYNDLGMYLS